MEELIWRQLDGWEAMYLSMMDSHFGEIGACLVSGLYDIQYYSIEDHAGEARVALQKFSMGIASGQGWNSPSSLGCGMLVNQGWEVGHSIPRDKM